MSARTDGTLVDVSGHTLRLSRLDKVMYPASATRKRDVLAYYHAVSDTMLRHISDRPMTLRRYPDGVGAGSFFAKRVPANAPPWMRRAAIPLATADRRGSGGLEAPVIDDEAALVWAANGGALEFHVPLWRLPASGDAPGHPDYIVFDLDPGPGMTIVDCCRVAQYIASSLDAGGVPIGAKTSGRKGLQLYLPTTGEPDWQTTRGVARDIARRVESAHPDAVVTNMRRSRRSGRVLIDWSQNHPAKTTVAAYSLRACDVPTVSTPISWDELDICADTRDSTALHFGPDAALDRIARLGDLMPLPLTSAGPRPTDGAPGRGGPHSRPRAH